MDLYPKIDDMEDQRDPDTIELSPFAGTLVQNIKSERGLGALSRFEQEKVLLNLHEEGELIQHEVDMIKAELMPLIQRDSAIVAVAGDEAAVAAPDKDLDEAA
jgi:hypothetical protein